MVVKEEILGSPAARSSRSGTNGVKKVYDIDANRRYQAVVGRSCNSGRHHVEGRVLGWPAPIEHWIIICRFKTPSYSSASAIVSETSSVSLPKYRRHPTVMFENSNIEPRSTSFLNSLSSAMTFVLEV